MSIFGNNIIRKQLNPTGGTIIELFRISADSQPGRVAGAIARKLRGDGFAEVQAVGAAAVNQAVKSVATARLYLLDDGLDLQTIPVFVEIHGMSKETRTGIRFQVYVLTDTNT